jgi:hypothetical protein
VLMRGLTKQLEPFKGFFLFDTSCNASPLEASQNRPQRRGCLAIWFSPDLF